MSEEYTSNLNHIASLFAERLSSEVKVGRTPNSQWQDLVGRFTVSYNNSTIPKYQITEKRMAMKLSPILKAEGIGYLEYFYNECAKKDNFGRWMNWSLNSRNVK